MRKTAGSALNIAYRLLKHIHFRAFFRKFIRADLPSDTDILFSSFLISWRPYLHKDGKEYTDDIMIGEVIEKARAEHSTLCLDSPTYFRSYGDTAEKFKQDPDWLCIEQFVGLRDILHSFFACLMSQMGKGTDPAIRQYFKDTGKAIEFSYVLNLRISEKIINTINPKILFLTCEYSRPHTELIYTAKKHNIPTIALQHGIITPKHPEYITKDKHRRAVLPDILCVYGEHYKDILTEHSIYDRSNIRVTGQPRYDMLHYARNIYSRERFLEKYKINPDHKIILWASSFHGRTDEDNIRNLETVFETAEALGDITIVIKPHPNDRKQQLNLIKKCIRRYNADVIIPPGKSDIYEQIFCCDILLTRNSTTGIEAVALNKPIIVMALDGSKTITDYADDGVAIEVYHEDELCPAIRGLIRGGDAELAKNRDSYIEKHLHKIDGRSTDRVIGIIRGLLEKH